MKKRQREKKKQTGFGCLILKIIPSVILVFFLSLPMCALYAQKAKLNVMTHKYAKGDQYRISIQHYYSVTLSAPSLRHFFSGETSYDVYLRCLESDGDVFDMQAHAEVTRVTRDGKNLTYQLRASQKQPSWTFAFDKFGRVLPESIKPSDGNSADSAWVKNFLWFLVLLPDYPVKPGESWDIMKTETEERLKTVITEPVRLTRSFLKGQYRLDEIEEGVAKISLDAELSGAGSAVALPNAQMEFDILVHLLGNYDLHPYSGKLISGQLTAEMAAIGTNAGKEVNFSGTHNLQFSVHPIK